LKNFLKKIMLQNLSDRLFWDVDPTLLDWDRDIQLIITRVFERGTLEEVRAVIRKYGWTKIVAAAKKIRSMDLLAVNFLAQISDTPITEFLCYNTRQLNQQHWIY
jgi:hypothetical protein